MVSRVVGDVELILCKWQVMVLRGLTTGRMCDYSWMGRTPSVFPPTTVLVPNTKTHASMPVVIPAISGPSISTPAPVPIPPSGVCSSSP